MRRAAIVSPIRTGVGKYLGSLSSLNAEDLAAIVIKDLVSRTGINPALIEEVVDHLFYKRWVDACSTNQVFDDDGSEILSIQ